MPFSMPEGIEKWPAVVVIPGMEKARKAPVKYIISGGWFWMTFPFASAEGL